MRSPTLPDWMALDNRFGTNDSELEHEMGVGVGEVLRVGHRQHIDRHRKIITERRSTDRRLESHILYIKNINLLHTNWSAAVGPNICIQTRLRLRHQCSYPPQWVTPAFG